MWWFDDLPRSPNVRAFPATLAFVAGVMLLTAPVADSQQASDEISRRLSLLALEHSRVTDPAGLAPLIEAAGAGAPELQRIAVRALGRLEQPARAGTLIPHLSADRAALRAEAASALAQIVSAPGIETSLVDPVRKALVDRLALETDPVVRGIMAEALGRLPVFNVDEFRRAEGILRTLAAGRGLPTLDVGPARGRTAFGTPVAGVTIGFDDRAPGFALFQVLGATKGLEALLCRNGKTAPFEQETVALLRELATTALNRPPSDALRPVVPSGVAALFVSDAPVRIRRLAMTALGSSRSADLGTIRRALDDRDAQVRRLAVFALGTAEGIRPDDVVRQLEHAMDEPGLVGYEALGVYAAYAQTHGCRRLLEAAASRNTSIAVRAIDLLPGACRPQETAPPLENLVRRHASANGASRRDWHRAAHALVSLARVDPDRARPALPDFGRDGSWLVRKYAARAAAILGDTASLEQLARDEHDNVRDAALTGLVEVSGHAADPLYIEALARRDHQLVRTAALALKGSPHRVEALPALFQALARITAERRDPSRDARLALIDRVAELGGPNDVADLRPYLEDFDPRVGGRAAEVMASWTNQVQPPIPRRQIPPLLPTAEELSGLSRSVARLTIRRVGTIDLELLVDEAPVTAARFARLAAEGYYNGLTFHRVVPNCILQGGSPGANEYTGDGDYFMDELGLAPHLRGSVGMSTRGRDTGDGQIFIDLVDNPRFDHEYTVFARVTKGLTDVVASILEGDVIEKIEIVRR